MPTSIHSSRAPYIIQATSVAGGFPLIISDARDLHVGRINDKFPSYPSRVLGGFGVAIMEDGQQSPSPSAKRAVAIRTGLGIGHAHQDTLNLDITALGCRLAPDLGGRDEGHLEGFPNMRYNKVHNLVEVDGKNFNNTTPGSTTSGTGWTRAFSPAPGCQTTIKDGRATSQPNVSLYERTTAMIDGPVTNELAPIYVFDVFRVAGGKVHTFCFHGADAGTDTANFQTNVDLKPATSQAALSYLSQYKDGTKREGIAPDQLQADWRLQAGQQQQWLGKLDENQRRHSRLTLFGQGGDAVYVGNAYSTHYGYEFPFLYAQKRSDTEGLQSTFVSTVETYAGEPYIASQRALKINDNESDAKAAVAVEVLLKNGRRDLLFADGRPEKVREVEGGLTTAGEFGFYSSDEQGVRQMHLMGGTQLNVNGIGIKAQYARYQGKITGVDYDHRTFTIDSKIPVGALAGEVALLGNPQHQAEFNLKGGAATKGGTRIQTVETPLYYQSRILNIDKNGVTPELEPGAYRSDSQYYEGATVTNEAHDKFWKTYLTSDERWMYIGWPGYRTSVPATIGDKDVPDANKDGKRKVLVYHYGPGDSFTLETHVAVARLAPGKYEIRTNVPCTITLPDKGKWVQLDGDEKPQPARIGAAGALTAVHITAEMLNGKPIVVQCVK